MGACQRIVVIIPALNEAAGVGRVIEAIPTVVDRIIVVDNGSTDGTAAVARAHGAVVVSEPRRGYGAACLRGIKAAADAQIVVFLDADNSDNPAEMQRLLSPLLADETDLVIGSRALGHAEAGAMTLPQRFGNALTSSLLRWIWDADCTDLGPFRAIRADALQALQLDHPTYGWTVQMQARALAMGLRVREVPVSYRRRIGRSKISGTIRGVVGAGFCILTTVLREAWRWRWQTDLQANVTPAASIVRPVGNKPRPDWHSCYGGSAPPDRQEQHRASNR